MTRDVLEDVKVESIELNVVKNAYGKYYHIIHFSYKNQILVWKTTSGTVEEYEEGKRLDIKATGDFTSKKRIIYVFNVEII